MNKKILKNGAVVEARNGLKYFKLDNALVRIGYNVGWLSLDEYNDDLTYSDDKDFTIMKVDNDVDNAGGYKVAAIYRHFNILKENKWTWEREEKPKCILTPKEHNYLKAVIEPVRNKVQFIYKDFSFRSSLTSNDDSLGYETIYIGSIIYIVFKGSNAPYSKMALYLFEENKQFKGMELYKEYSLKELGL